MVAIRFLTLAALLTTALAGRLENWNGTSVYVSYPPVPPKGPIPPKGSLSIPKGALKNKDVILFLTDIGGHLSPPTQELADKFARDGNYIVVVPDLFAGDPIPIPAPGGGPIVIPDGWVDKQSPAAVDPRIDLALSEIKRRFSK